MKLHPMTIVITVVTLFITIVGEIYHLRYQALWFIAVDFTLAFFAAFALVTERRLAKSGIPLPTKTFVADWIFFLLPLCWIVFTGESMGVNVPDAIHSTACAVFLVALVTFLCHIRYSMLHPDIFNFKGTFRLPWADISQHANQDGTHAARKTKQNERLIPQTGNHHDGLREAEDKSPLKR